MAEVTELEIKRIKVKDRHRKDMGDIEALAQSIASNGLLHPVVTTTDGRLIAGARRLEACKLLGHKSILSTVVDVPSLLVAERDENFARKDLTPSECVSLADEIAAEIGNRQGQRTDLQEPDAAEADGNGETSGQMPESEEQDGPKPGEATRDFVAERAGFSSETDYRRTKAVVEKGIPELVALMDAGGLRPGPAAKIAELPKAEQKRAVKAIEAGEKYTPTEKEKPQPAPAAAVKDDLGADVPRKLAKVFTDVSEGLRDCKRALNDMISSCAKAEGKNKWLMVEETKQALLKARDKLEEGIPHAVHPRCDSKGCDGCRGAGWVPEWQYHRLVDQNAWEKEEK